MLLSLFALSIATAQPASSLPSAASDASAVVGISVVYLDCQVGQTTLTDCRIVNDADIDARTAATALKLAADMTVPAALAARNPGRITLKLNVNN
jgi:hypothetical protein